MNNTDSAAFNLAYNTDRETLRMPEYGRHVQSMIAYCMTLTNREQRTKVAHSIIDVIGNLNPSLRDDPEYKHKLWDHLRVMSDFGLDVDAPYPTPTREGLAGRPEHVNYPKALDGARYYGVLIQNGIASVASMEDSDDRREMEYDLANQMKRAYLAWNKDFVEDEFIWNDLKRLSGGALGNHPEELSVKRGYVSPSAPIRQKKKKKKPASMNKRRTQRRK